ncbi:MAG: hypothetical protein Q8P64_09385 [Deltaproteobacteria bacterium]|nr:hypothetical protein [Deltaproteobacteria bacterium]
MLPSQTLPDFQQYLLSRKLVPVKNVNFYAYWASRYLTFSKRLKNADPAEALRLFLEDLRSRENIADWQIRQAEEAVQLYSDHFRDGKAAGSAVDAKTPPVSFDKDLVMATMRKAIRVKHYSLSTERTYMDWARRFFDYAGNMKGGLLQETPSASVKTLLWKRVWSAGRP